MYRNPFSNYGQIVYGESFWGRGKDIKIIANRVVNPKEPGNLAIIGLPRIGKSSLAYHVFVYQKKALVERDIIPIWINLATYQNSVNFFVSLVEKCLMELENIDIKTDEILKLGNLIIQDYKNVSIYNKIQRFFKKVRQKGFKIVFILDEFDYARYLFKNDVVNFQRLRDLSYNPEWRVTFVTTSRRSIRDIELQTKSISTLDGIFLKHYLSMFDYADLQEYFSQIEIAGIRLDEKIRNDIFSYCGGYPYLLNILGYKIVEDSHQKKDSSIETVFSAIEQSFLDHYQHLVSLLQEDGSLSKLFQVLFGPRLDLRPADLVELENYGLIRRYNDEYSTFSLHFYNYLDSIKKDVPIWSLWNQTEKLLRKIITLKLENKYGKNWIDKIEKSKPNLKRIFDKSREAMLKEKRSFGYQISDNLLDYTYPVDLFQIILSEWDVFGSILGKDKNYWNARASLLGKIRTPLAHNRFDGLSKDIYKIAEGYCEEIVRIIRKHLNE